MAVLVDVRYLCTECGYSYSNGAEPLDDRDLGAETQRAREVGECHMKEVHGTESPKEDSSWRGALEGVVRHHTTRLDQINARVQACEINACQKVTALAESLSRRLDALEKQAGPVGRPPDFQGVWQPQSRSGLGDPFYAVPASPDLTASYRDMLVPKQPFGSGGSDSDSKDALIRDLLDCFADRRIYPPHEYALSREKLCRRAEKLGVKL